MSPGQALRVKQSGFASWQRASPSHLCLPPRFAACAKPPKRVKQQPLNTIATDWTDLVLICRKCSRKLDGGFGADGDETLRRALRGALRRRALRGTIGLVEVDCFGVCPKRAVTVAHGSHADQFLIVPEHFSADALLDRMLDTPSTTTLGDAQP